MSVDHNSTTPTSTPQPKPYCIVGAGHLTSHLWIRIQSDESVVYRFNLFRTQRNGRVTQLLRPQDVLPLAKFVRVISQVLVDDGCTSPKVGRLLKHLATALDDVIESPEVQLLEHGTKVNRKEEPQSDGGKTCA